MEHKNIVITEANYQRLHRLIESSKRSHRLDSGHLDDLEQALEEAIVVESGEVPPDVVTMNSLVRMRDMENGLELTYQIVFPRDANVTEKRISVLAPIGSALLGLRSGATVEFMAPSGIRRFRILNVEHQLEPVLAVA